MKRINQTLWLVVCLTLLSGFGLIGCSGKETTPGPFTEIDVGVVVNVDYVQETLTTWAKTNVTTTKGVFVLSNHISVLKGDAATLRVYESGSQVICFESLPICPRIRGT